MAKFCLPHDIANKFLETAKAGGINPGELLDMSSKERRDFFSTIVGEENAKEVNTNFEAAVISKQKKALTTWLEKTGRTDKVTKKDILDKINKLDTLLTPKDQKSFLEDLVASKLKISVSAEEAKTITELAGKLEETKKSMEAGGDRMEYGRAKVALENYLHDRSEIGADLKSKAISFTALPKALQATLDFSAPLRQGRALLLHKEWRSAFVDMFKYAAKPGALEELKAYIVSHPDYNLAKEAKLAVTALPGKVGQREEQFASKLAGKIPLVSGSERAYEGFLSKLRFDSFVNMVEGARSAGRDVENDAKLTKSIAELVNSATGRGSFGNSEQAVKAWGQAFFSPRFLKSRLDMINPIFYLKQDPFVRKQALKIALSVAATTATALGLAKAAGLDAEVSPLSSDYGKVKVGNTRVDVTGGYGNIIRFVAQQIMGQAKSSTTGKVTSLTSGKFGAPTRLDKFYEFFQGKEAPLASFLTDVMKGKDFDGNDISFKEPKTVLKDLGSRFIPLVYSDLKDLKDDGGLKSLGIFGPLALFGAGVQTYGSVKPKLEKLIGGDPNPDLVKELSRLQSTGSLPSLSTVDKTTEFTKLKEQKGDGVYQQALSDFRSAYTKDSLKLIRSGTYRKADDETKGSLLDSLKEKEKSKIFDKPKYKLKKEKKPSPSDLLKKAGIR